MRQRTEPERLSAKVSRDTRGFNAAELAVVVLLVGIMGVVATPLVNKVIDKNRLDGAASKIAGDLRYAQSLAVSRGNMYRLVTDTGSCTTQSGQTRYRIERSTDGGASWSAITDATIAEKTTASQCYRLSSEFPGATLASITGTPSSPTVTEVRFNSRGTCTNCTGANPPLRVTVSSPYGTKIVQVRTTGSVDIQ
jgi:Tfp pilus assembly protein FimT